MLKSKRKTCLVEETPCVKQLSLSLVFKIGLTLLQTYFDGQPGGFQLTNWNLTKPRHSHCAVTIRSLSI
jgi:hypothetical protein